MDARQDVRRREAHARHVLSAPLLWAGVAFSAWGFFIAAAGGINLFLFGVNISSRDPFRPCVAAAFCAAFYLWKRRNDTQTTDGAMRADSAIAAAVVAFGVAFAALRWGSFVAGGADSYGYISQANLWLAGSLTTSQPWAASLPWTDTDWIAAPVGYRPGLLPHTIVPTYPAGFPMLIAVFQAAGAERLILPTFAAATVWVTYLIARDSIGRGSAGVIAAVLLAVSPVFLHQAMWTMADVPAAFFWTLAVWLGTIRTATRPALAGVAAGAALLIRPNLALLACVLPLVWMIANDRPWHRMAAFAAGLAPFAAGVAAVNTSLYGAPWTSGYGDVGGLFTLSHVPQNLRLFGGWTSDTQTRLFIPALAAAFAFLGRRRSESRLPLVSGLMIAAVLLSYIAYQPFDAWWYLRFLLPAWPVCCAMIAAMIALASRYSRSRAEMYAAAALLCSPLVVPAARSAVDLGVFEVGHAEERYIATAQIVSNNTPADAIVIADQHSGSIRYYGNRKTVRLPYIAADSLGPGVRRLSESQPVYMFLERWEETAFRNQFGAANSAAFIDAGAVVATPDGQARLFRLSAR